MNNKSTVALNNPSVISILMGWSFGLLFVIIALINLFWGNDPGFGVCILLLACIYFPPLNLWFTKLTDRTVPTIVKFLLGLFILWAALGVGELFDKIGMMIIDLR